uniref:Uncharacterized protein n=1 Tax=Craspedostauros australis TaxID=1486917 RepID=A0A7R9WSW6_9STRA
MESERFRADNAAKQAEAAKTKLQSISTMQDYRAMFTESWILKDNACVAHLEQLWDASAKEALTQLLQVEAKSAKWYCQLPRAYFEDLSKDLARQSTLSVLMDRVRQESEKLNSALFKLSEQQGGVPRIYLQAAEARKAEGHDKQNHDNGNDDDNDDDDDEIVFLKCEQLASEKAGPCVKQNGGAAFRSVA